MDKNVRLFFKKLQSVLDERRSVVKKIVTIVVIENSSTNESRETFNILAFLYCYRAH